MKLPALNPPSTGGDNREGGGGLAEPGGAFEHLGGDILATIKEQAIGFEGMRIDRDVLSRSSRTGVRENDVHRRKRRGRPMGPGHRLREQAKYSTSRTNTTRSTSCAKRPAWTAVSRCARYSKKSSASSRALSQKTSCWRRSSRSSSLIRSPKRPRRYRPSRPTSRPTSTSDAGARTSSRAGQFTDLATNPFFHQRLQGRARRSIGSCIPEYIKDYVSLNQFAA